MVSATQRTLKALREQGCLCGMVERFNPYAGAHGIRQDLFGIIDIIALDTKTRGIQSTTGSQFQEHWVKLTQEKRYESLRWILAGNTLELWAWRKLKIKRGMKATKWVPRIANITLKDLANVFS